MANIITFWRGLLGDLPDENERSDNALYFGYSADNKNGKLYLGKKIIAEVNNTDSVTINSLIEGAIESLNSTATSTNGSLLTVSVDQVGGLLSSVGVNENRLNDALEQIRLSISEINSKNGEPNKIDAFLINNESAVDTNKIISLKAASFTLDPAAPAGMDTLVSKYYVDTNTDVISGNVNAAMNTANQAVSLVGQVANQAVDGLKLTLSTDGKLLSLKNQSGITISSINTSQFLIDGMLSNVEIDQDLNLLVFTWNTDSGKTKSTSIELSSIADIYKGSEGNVIKVNISNDNTISAEIKPNSIYEDRLEESLRFKINYGFDYTVPRNDPYYQQLCGMASIWSSASSKVGAKESIWDNGIQLASSALQEIDLCGITVNKDNPGVATDQLKDVLGIISLELQSAEALDLAYGASYSVSQLQSAIDADYKTWANTKSLIQGNTDVTVENVVLAINKINEDVIELGESVIEMFTWGEF